MYINIKLIYYLYIDLCLINENIDQDTHVCICIYFLSIFIRSLGPRGGMKEVDEKVMESSTTNGQRGMGQGVRISSKMICILEKNNFGVREKNERDTRD